MPFIEKAGAIYGLLMSPPPTPPQHTHTFFVNQGMKNIHMETP